VVLGRLEGVSVSFAASIHRALIEPGIEPEVDLCVCVCVCVCVWEPGIEPEVDLKRKSQE
jgi:hypothetical protein